jgi:hypothetical protein
LDEPLDEEVEVMVACAKAPREPVSAALRELFTVNDDLKLALCMEEPGLRKASTAATSFACLCALASLREVVASK